MSNPIWIQIVYMHAQSDVVQVEGHAACADRVLYSPVTSLDLNRFKDK